jgi:hypothetical protein
MIVSATSYASHNSSGDLPHDAPRHDEPATESRALVVMSPAAESEASANFRQAPFLAQLIANKEQLPQTRERRRAEPAEAIAAYRAAEALTARR